MIRYKVYNFLKDSNLNKFFVGFLLFMVLGAVVVNIMFSTIVGLYYKTMNGDFFLNMKAVTAEEFVVQGEELLVTFCRNPRSGSISATNNIRTFYVDENGRYVKSLQVNLPDGVIYERLNVPCVAIRVSPDNLPQEVGRYHFCQEFNFYVEDNRKFTSFCSTPFRVVAKDK